MTSKKSTSEYVSRSKRWPAACYPATRAAVFVLAALEEFGPDAAMRGKLSFDRFELQAKAIEYVGENEHDGEEMAEFSTLQEALDSFRLFLEIYEE